MRLIFAGTPDFAVPSLRAVAETDHEISLVVTQPDRRRGRGRRISFPPVKKAALELEAEVFQPENVNSPESVERLEAAEAEVGVVVAYGQILSRKVLDTPARGFLNVHASLLPKYRGAAPINWAVIRGEDKTGVSVQRMREELDAGALLGQKEVDIKARETAGELHDRLAPIGAELLVKVLERMSRQDGLQPKSQDGEPSYAPRLSRKEGDVDWSSAAEDIKNWVRGVTPWPGALTELQTRGG
ncbi:MAG: methionyl-tRNA formyltransferase, partial [Planctomycetes bacterium]|nr:methionyl-tRNA formyltransferase [Planctomycetota bacterium]